MARLPDATVRADFGARGRTIPILVRCVGGGIVRVVWPWDLVAAVSCWRTGERQRRGCLGRDLGGLPGCRVPSSEQLCLELVSLA